MVEIYDEAKFDFLHVSYVYSQNTHAYDRMKNEFNFLGTPTVWFDGGDEVVLGGYVGCKQDYEIAIRTCGLRAVHDLDLEVSATWQGNATLEITAKVVNNDAGPDNYGGRLRVYVTEIESSLWKDTVQNPYPFAFLDYAFNEVLDLAPNGGTWEQTMTWVGADHNNGHGVSYDFIKITNVAVIAAVYNDEWNQGYSYPPSSNPFDAYYVDDAAIATPPTLWADKYEVSETGDTSNLTVYLGPDYAQRQYIILGSYDSASTPGWPLPGGLVTLPLNRDWFTNLVVIPLMNSSIFDKFMGNTNLGGQASPQLNVPPLPPGFVGEVMYFAYCLAGPFDYVSNRIAFTIVP